MQLPRMTFHKARRSCAGAGVLAFQIDLPLSLIGGLETWSGEGRVKILDVPLPPLCTPGRPFAHIDRARTIPGRQGELGQVPLP